MSATVQCKEVSRGSVATADDHLGMAWWNGLTRRERKTVLMQAGRRKYDPSAADAWQLWREGLISTDSQSNG